MRKDRPPDIPLEKQQVLGAPPLPSPPQQPSERSIAGANVSWQNPHQFDSFEVGNGRPVIGNSNPRSNELHQYPFQQCADLAPMIEDERQDEVADQGLLTCWFWDRYADCKHGLNCVFEHRPTSTVAFDGNQLTKAQATCPYWFRQTCRKDAFNCRFSHHRTGYVAGDSRTRTAKRFNTALNMMMQMEHSREVSSDERVINNHNQRSSRNDIMKDSERSSSEERLDQIIKERFNGQDPFRPPPKPYLGCYFYNMSTCRNSAEACSFQHETLPWIANAGKIVGGDRSALWNGERFGQQPTKREDFIAEARREDHIQICPAPPFSVDEPPPSPHEPLMAPPTSIPGSQSKHHTGTEAAELKRPPQLATRNLSNSTSSQQTLAQPVRS